MKIFQTSADRFSNIKKMSPLMISICVLVGLFYFQKIDTELLFAFDAPLFLMLVSIAVLLAVLGSIRLFLNLRPFYDDLSFKNVHQVNVYSMLSGLLFGGILGSTVTKISMPSLNKVNKNLLIIISMVEKIITLGCMASIGLLAFIILKKVDTQALVTLVNGFDLIVVMALFVFGSLFLFKQYIFELLKLISAFFLNTCVCSMLIVLFNLAAIYLVLNTLLDISIAEKIMYAAVLMFVGSLPISFQGIGVREAVAVYLLAPYQLDSSILIGNVLMISFASILAISIMPLTVNLLPSITRGYKQKGSPVFHTASDYLEKNLSLISIPCILFCLFEVRLLILNWQVPLAFSDLFAMVLFFILIASLLNNKVNISLIRTIRILAAILCYFMLSFLYGWLVNNEFSAWAMNSRILGGLLLFGYIQAGFWIFKINTRTIRHVLITIFGIITVYGLVFIFLHLFQMIYGDAVYPNMIGKFYGARFLGTGTHPVTMAFSLSFILVVFFMVFNKNIITMRFFILSAFILSLCVGLTQSLCGIITVFVLSVVWFASDIKKYKGVALSVLGGLLLSIMIISSFQLDRKPVSSFSLGNYGSMVEDKDIQFKDQVILRYNAWQEGGNVSFELFKKNWLIGAGLGATLLEFGKSDKPVKPTYSAASLYLADTGLAGLSLIFALFVCLYLQIKNKLKDKFLMITFFSGMVAIGIFSIVHDISYQRFLWIWVGMLVALSGKEKPDGKIDQDGYYSMI